MDASEERDLTDAMLALDGTPTKSKLGRMRSSQLRWRRRRAMADHLGIELYQYLGRFDCQPAAHADDEHSKRWRACRNNVDFQEFMIVPVGATSFSEALRWGVETFPGSQGRAEGARLQHRGRR